MKVLSVIARPEIVVSEISVKKQTGRQKTGTLFNEFCNFCQKGADLQETGTFNEFRIFFKQAFF